MDDSSEVLWHYTNWSGLEGILRSKSIWASHIAYLNDEQEVRNTLNIVMDELRHGVGRREGASIDEAVNAVENTLHGLRRVNVCVASFSAAVDQLSQWRAYGQPSPGFAIGFGRKELAGIAARRQMRLIECVYDHNLQRSKVRRVVQDWVADVVEQSSGGELSLPTHNENAWRLAQQILGEASQLKHPAFKEEREFRLVTDPVSFTASWGFHRAGSMIVPHMEISFSEAKDAVREVVVGPTAHMEATMGAVMTLLVSNDMRGSVRRSDVPYRNW